MDGWYGRIFTRLRLLRPRQADPQVHQEGARRPALQGADQDQGRGHQPHLRGADPEDPEVDAVQGRRRDAAAHPRVRRAGGHVHDLPRVRRHAAQRGGAVVEDRRKSASPTRARCRSATSPTGCAGSTSRRSRRCSRRCSRPLDSFVEIGLGYLSLDRPSGTLSGGEAQRTKMIRHLGSSLTDVTYVFDEPTIGLHPHDIQRMNDLLLRLRDKGNTVLVVEHKPETIAIADHVVDLGPGAGTAGGEVVLRGHRRRAAGERHAHRPPPRRPRRAQGRGAHADRRARDPRRDRAQPAGRRRRHPARRARRRHRRRGLGQELAHPRLDPGRRRAWCRSTRARSAARGAATRRPTPACSTRSARRSRRPTASSPRCSARTPRARAPPATARASSTPTSAMMAGVATACEECEGKRFQASVLEYQLGGRDISEVLAMSVTEAEAFFGAGEAAHARRARDPRPARRRRARLPQPRPAADDAVRRRAAAAQARDAHGREGRRLRARRADHRPAPRRRRAAARPARPAGRLRASR